MERTLLTVDNEVSVPFFTKCDISEARVLLQTYGTHCMVLTVLMGFRNL